MIIKPKRIKNTTNSPQVIGMIHVLSNNLLQNTLYNDLFKIPNYDISELKTIDSIKKRLYELYNEVLKEYSNEVLKECRGSIFVLKRKEVEELENELSNLNFAKYLVNRALEETTILVNNGFNVILIENDGAPYFIDSALPFEDLLIMNLIAKKIRQQFPELVMGIHVLVNDVESIPIAIECGAYFIRSETSVFSGFRPEGKTINIGNQAKFNYFRNWLNSMNGVLDAAERRYPQIWCDLQKKHTVFEQEIRDLNLWVDNILFMKLEAIILTGVETGKDVEPKDFEIAHAGLDKLKVKSLEYFGQSIEIPLITGSGLDVPNCKKYADFVIVGTTLKERGYWENSMSDQKVKELVEKMK